MTLIWRRPRTVVLAPQSAPVPRPTPVHRPAPVVVVLPSWWETATDANGKVYYKNNHRMTTSWTPPSAEQIAEETRERNAQAAGQDLPPPDYLPPPAFDEYSAPTFDY